MFKSGDRVRIKEDYKRSQLEKTKSLLFIFHGYIFGRCICEYIGNDDLNYLRKYLHNCNGYFKEEIGRL